MRVDEHDYPGQLRGDGGAGLDVLDARGTFDKQEVWYTYSVNLNNRKGQPERTFVVDTSVLYIHM